MEQSINHRLSKKVPVQDNRKIQPLESTIGSRSPRILIYLALSLTLLGNFLVFCKPIEGEAFTQNLSKGSLSESIPHNTEIDELAGISKDNENIKLKREGPKINSLPEEYRVARTYSAPMPRLRREKPDEKPKVQREIESESEKIKINSKKNDLNDKQNKSFIDKLIERFRRSIQSLIFRIKKIKSKLKQKKSKSNDKVIQNSVISKANGNEFVQNSVDHIKLSKTSEESEPEINSLVNEKNSLKFRGITFEKDLIEEEILRLKRQSLMNYQSLLIFMEELHNLDDKTIKRNNVFEKFSDFLENFNVHSSILDLERKDMRDWSIALASLTIEKFLLNENSNQLRKEVRERLIDEIMKALLSNSKSENLDEDLRNLSLGIYNSIRQGRRNLGKNSDVQNTINALMKSRYPNQEKKIPQKVF